jgi:hypothetical protein
MGIWALPKSEADVEKLKTFLHEPLAVSGATDRLYNVFGCDELFDNLDAAARLDPNSDGRGVLVARIAQVYFTHQPAEEICGVAAASKLSAIVESFSAAEDDVYKRIQKVKTEEAARDLVMWACDAKKSDAPLYTAVPDFTGLDFVVSGPNDKLYRVETVGEVVVEVVPRNHDYYRTLFEAGHSMSL